MRKVFEILNSHFKKEKKNQTQQHMKYDRIKQDLFQVCSFGLIFENPSVWPNKLKD